MKRFIAFNPTNANSNSGLKDTKEQAVNWGNTILSGPQAPPYVTLAEVTEVMVRQIVPVVIEPIDVYAERMKETLKPAA